MYTLLLTEFNFEINEKAHTHNINSPNWKPDIYSSAKDGKVHGLKVMDDRFLIASVRRLLPHGATGLSAVCDCGIS